MERQLIISIGREFGSGGHVIGEALAKNFSLPFYDNNLLEKIAKNKGVYVEDLKKYDEHPKASFFTRTVRGFSSSPHENTAHLQFDQLRKMASDGESFVIVGRCAEDKLASYEGLISIFITGDQETKLKRVMEVYDQDAATALSTMKKMDYNRKSYHNYFCKGKWGDSRFYDMCINSSRLGIENTIKILTDYIKCRQEVLNTK